MAAIPARELRNHTAEVLRRAEAGGEIEVFKDNRLVAKIIPFSRRRQWLPASEIGGELVRLGPDTTGLSEELRATLTETTDDLPLVIPNGVGRYVRLYRPWGCTVRCRSLREFPVGVSAIALGELRLGVLQYSACTFSLESPSL
jgi:prevent-host-death family protein